MKAKHTLGIAEELASNQILTEEKGEEGNNIFCNDAETDDIMGPTLDYSIRQMQNNLDRAVQGHLCDLYEECKARLKC